MDKFGDLVDTRKIIEFVAADSEERGLLGNFDHVFCSLDHVLFNYVFQQNADTYMFWKNSIKYDNYYISDIHLH